MFVLRGIFFRVEVPFKYPILSLTDDISTLRADFHTLFRKAANYMLVLRVRAVFTLGVFFIPLSEAYSYSADGERGDRVYKGGLGTEPATGSRAGAPGQGRRPLKLKAFSVCTTRWIGQFVPKCCDMSVAYGPLPQINNF